jgi:hypothetical protein
MKDDISSVDKMQIALSNPKMINEIEMPSFESLSQIKTLYDNKGLVKNLKTNRPDIFSALLSRHFPEYMDSIDPAEVQAKDMAWFIMANPNMILKFDVSKMDSYHIGEVIAKHPQLFSKFDKSQILNLDKSDIQKVLFFHPKLKSDFKEVFDKAIEEVLSYAEIGEQYANGTLEDMKAPDVISQSDVINMTRFRD